MTFHLRRRFSRCLEIICEICLLLTNSLLRHGRRASPRVREEKLIEEEKLWSVFNFMKQQKSDRLGSAVESDI